jgi:hypothetical protein
MVISVMFLAVVLGMAALTLDGGRWLTERRNLQGMADAAAMAGVHELPQNSEDAAEFAANDYVLQQDDFNADDASVILNEAEDNAVTVRLTTDSPGFFSGILGIDSAGITVDATARVRQANGMPPGMLPFGVMRDSYTLGENMQIRDDNASNRGLVLPPAGDDCGNTSGGKDEGDMIDQTLLSCTVPVGDMIGGKSGWTAGQVRAGFDTRLAGNSQSFDDVFEWDDSSDRYVVRDMDSPRLGWIPIIENPNQTTEWPNGNSPFRVLGYLAVYIGNTDAGNPYPAYDDNGKEVYLTPVAASMPPDWDHDSWSDDVDSDNPSPIQRFMTE